MTTLSKAREKMEDTIKSLTNEGFEVSAMIKISCSSNGVHGTTSISHNPDDVAADAIESYLRNEGI